MPLAPVHPAHRQVRLNYLTLNFQPQKDKASKMIHSQTITIIGILLTTLFTAHLGHAEQDRLSVRTLAVDKSDIPAWYVATEGEGYTELTWPVTQPSSAIVSTAGKDLLLFSKETNAEGVVEFTVARKLTIPEATDEVMVVAWPDDGDEKIGLLAVADDLSQAKSNHWIVINASKHKVTLRYGTKTDAIQLEPREAKPYRIDSDQGQGSAVLAQMIVKDEWKDIYSTYWAAPEKQRSLALFYNKNERAALRRVIDPLPPGK